ncbi:MAG: nitrate/nitrite transporter NrtS [Pseudomonadota bacterium]
MVDAGKLRRALRAPYLVKSLAVAAVVGTVLNGINQGDAIVSGQAVNFLKLCLTYAVPFCVSTYGVYSAIGSER